MTDQFLYLAIWIFLWATLAGVCAFAFWRGGQAERSAASLIVLVAVASSASRLFLHPDNILIARLLAEGVAAMGFLILALRHGSLWIGAVMLIQAFQFSLQAFYFVTGRHHDLLYVIANNVNFLGILICLAAGVWLKVRTQDRGPAQAREAPAN